MAKYIPKIKQSKASKGTFLDPKTGQMYSGNAIQDFRGNVYKGTEIKPDSKPLRSLPNIEEVESAGKKISQSYRKPAEEDYRRGQYTRYFVQEIASGKTYELKLETYKQVLQERGDRYRGGTIEWTLGGQIEDEMFVGGFIKKGAATKNREATSELERVLPGVSEILLKNPREFLK